MAIKIKVRTRNNNYYSGELDGGYPLHTYLRMFDWLPLGNPDGTVHIRVSEILAVEEMKNEV